MIRRRAGLWFQMTNGTLFAALVNSWNTKMSLTPVRAQIIFFPFWSPLLAERSITQQDSEDFKTEVILKLILYSRILAIPHTIFSAMWYRHLYNNPFLSSPQEFQMIVCAAAATNILVGQVYLLGVHFTIHELADCRSWSPVSSHGCCFDIASRYILSPLEWQL